MLGESSEQIRIRDGLVAGTLEILRCLGAELARRPELKTSGGIAPTHFVIREGPMTDELTPNKERNREANRDGRVLKG